MIGFNPIAGIPTTGYFVRMPLLNVVLTLLVIGVILWLINTYIPLQATIKQILNLVVVIVVILWLLNVFGILGSSGEVHMPKIG